MKTLRNKLDSAGTEDGRKYMLTIASPASAYLLRGMENFQVTQYLDYVNLMTYDFHGAWNHFVGHNAALFDNKADPELSQWGSTPRPSSVASVISTPPGRLTTSGGFGGGQDQHRGALLHPWLAGGYRWHPRPGGKAALPSQSDCQPGTGGSTIPCGNGAVGIDNIWHDLDKNGKEIGGGAVPMWHAKNLSTRPASASPHCRATARPGVWIPTTRPT